MEALLLRGIREPRLREFHGFILMERGDSAGAKSIYEEMEQEGAISPSGLYNLGRIAQVGGDLEKAASLYRKALELDPTFHLAWNNLGLTELEAGRPSEAARSFSKALEGWHGFAEAWNNLGVALDELRRPAEAITAFKKAIELKGDYISPMFNLAQLYQRAGRFQEAEQLLMMILHLDPCHQEASFMMAALKGELRERPPSSYVKSLFNQTASHFDHILTEELEYKTPGMLYHHLVSVAEVKGKILDAGCGTGLGAELYRRRASLLIGVDIAFKMLQEAKKKGVYDMLLAFDLLESWPLSISFDVIYAADVLVYCGSLELIFSHFRRGLRSGGVLGFSVELLQDSEEDLLLQPNGRYAHAESYVDKALVSNHFITIKKKRAALRTEGGSPVEGLLVAAQAARRI